MTTLVYEMPVTNATIKSKTEPQQPHAIYKDGKFHRIYSDTAYSEADAVSTVNAIYVDTGKGKKKEVKYQCQRISYDCDFKYSSDEFKKTVIVRSYNDSTKRFESQSKEILCHKLFRASIAKNYPDLVKFCTIICRSRNDGLSISIFFPSFELQDRLISTMARNLQKRIGCLFQHIGIGVDTAAYGLIRDVPNENNPKFARYKNKKKGYSRKSITRKDVQGYPRRLVISELLEITEQYKPIWDESKKANPDKYLYANVSIESMMANLYRQGFKSQDFKNQKTAAEFLDICVPTFRLWLKGKAPSCLTIEPTLSGYTITLSMTDDQQKRARAVLTHNDLDRWIFPHPTDVQDGIRNKYISRCAITLKMMGFREYKTLEIMREMVTMIPGHQNSENCKNVADIVASIYQSRPYEEGQYKNLQPIPGLESVMMVLEGKNRKVLSGDLGEDVKTEKAVKSKSLKSVELSQIVPSVFTVTYRNGRLTEDLLDRDQKKIHKIGMETFLKPSINPLLSQNVYAYVEGQSPLSWKKRNDQLSHVFNHVLKLDVKGYFSSIDQNILKSKMLETLGSEITEVIFAAVTADRIINGEIQKRESGIPQGSTFSNILSNLYLNDFDHWLEAKGFKFTRFSDDIRIFSHSKEKLVSTLEAIKQYLKENLKLTLNENKTKFMECGDVV